MLLRLDLAFVKAVRGNVETAELHLASIPSRMLTQSNLAPLYHRARAMIAYKKEEWSEVIEIARGAKGMHFEPRDAALLHALEQSSLLRHERAPLRAAAIPDAFSDNEWMETIAPELALR
jgi:hypothetical protein